MVGCRGAEKKGSRLPERVRKGGVLDTKKWCGIGLSLNAMDELNHRIIEAEPSEASFLSS